MEPEKGNERFPAAGESDGLPKLSYQAKIIDSSDNEYWNYCDNC